MKKEDRPPRRALLIVGALSAMSLGGCEFFIDAAIDCIDNDRPVLSPNILPDPILNQTYSELIRVSIRNEPRDDNFDFLFTTIGDLPEGIQVESAGRDFRLFGTPIELGDFSFSVRVEVRGTPGSFNDTSGLCLTVDTNSYQWSIQIT